MFTTNIRIVRSNGHSVDQMVRRHAAAAIERAAQDAADHLKDAFENGPSSPGDAPGVDSGRLRASVEQVPVGEARRAIRAATPYAAHLEFGTRHMAARPFMTPLAYHLTRVLPGYFDDLL